MSYWAIPYIDTLKLTLEQWLSGAWLSLTHVILNEYQQQVPKQVILSLVKSAAIYW